MAINNEKWEYSNNGSSDGKKGTEYSDTVYTHVGGAKYGLLHNTKHVGGEFSEVHVCMTTSHSCLARERASVRSLPRPHAGARGPAQSAGCGLWGGAVQRGPERHRGRETAAPAAECTPHLFAFPARRHTLGVTRSMLGNSAHMRVVSSTARGGV